MPLRDVPKRFNQQWAGVSFHNRSAFSARYRLLLIHARGTLAENVYGQKFQAMWKQVCFHIHQTHTSRYNTLIFRVQTMCLCIELPRAVLHEESCHVSNFTCTQPRDETKLEKHMRK